MGSNDYTWSRDEYDQYMELIVGYAAGIERADTNHAAQTLELNSVKTNLAKVNTDLTNRIQTLERSTVPAKVEALDAGHRDQQGLITDLQQALVTTAETIRTLNDRITALEQASHTPPVQPDPPADDPAEPQP